MKKNLLFIVFTFLITILLYFFIFRHSFFQDDFILLHDFQLNSFQDLLNIFIPQNTIYYRPLANGLFFGLLPKIFTIHSQAFHLVALLLHFSAGYLLLKLIKKVTNSNFLSYLVFFGYLTSSLHFLSLLWIGQVPILLGMVIYLTLLLISLQSRPKFPIWLLFIFGLLIHEMVILAPLAWFLLTRKISKKIITYWWPIIPYLFFRFILFPIPISGTYQPAFGLITFKSSLWYFAWLFNLPEEIKYQTISLFPPQLIPDFIANFRPELIVWIAFSIIIILFSFILPLIAKAKLITKNKLIGLGLMAIGFLPLLIAPEHQYPFLLAFSLPGFLLILADNISQFFKSIKSTQLRIFYLVLLAIFWLVLSAVTLNFSQLTHWSAIEAKTITHYQKELSQLPVQTDKPGIIFLKKDSLIKQRKASLADQLGMRYLTQNPQMMTHFGHYDLIADQLPEICFQTKERPTKDFKECLELHNVFIIREWFEPAH